MSEVNAAREETAYFMRRLYERGLTTTSGGNISCRDGDGILITPSSLDKARISPQQIGRLALDGTNLTPHLKPSIEAGLHLAIYRERPDVGAVVHAHPAAATAFAACGREINCSLMAESRAILGCPVTASYALMGTPELAAIVAEAVRRADCILMANHGVLTVGRTLLEAFDRLEVLENTARITLAAAIIGGATELSAGQLLEIDRLMGRPAE